MKGCVGVCETNCLTILRTVYSGKYLEANVCPFMLYNTADVDSLCVRTCSGCFEFNISPRKLIRKFYALWKIYSNIQHIQYV